MRSKIMLRPRLLAFIALILFFASCKTDPKKSAPPDILAANIDSSINPGDDFYTYAIGGWMKKNPIPSDESGWGIGNMVMEELYKRKRDINEKAVGAKEGNNQKIGDFWQSAMDTIEIEKQGIKPLQPWLDSINNIKDIAGLMTRIAQMHRFGAKPAMGLGIGQDAKNSDVMAFYLGQGGLGLNDRDYYFNTDSRSANIRKEYGSHLAKMMQLLGEDPATATAHSNSIIQLETQLAKASRKLEALRDPYANYNKMSVTQLGALTPSVNWPAMLNTYGISKIDSVIVGQPEFYTNLETLLKSTSLDNWKAYLRWNLIRRLGSYLSSNFSTELFNFYGKIVRGAQAQRPRWKRVLDAEEDAMGEALGQLFVKEYFGEAAKKRYEDMVEAVRAALKTRIEKLAWMSDSTKQKALAKLAAMKKKVGYPDKWKDFSAMKIEKGPYATNIIRAAEWWHNYELNKLGKPVDRTEWEITPQTYNAYYNPSNNEIVLPAGIFTVPGFRDEELDDALVYGYAGASTIGHEITHGFDDEGRQFDEKGNLKSWWTKTDEDLFNQRAAVMVKQFDEYYPIDTLKIHINGKATLGENIADLGGVLLGWDAFTQTEAYKKGEKISGFTQAQRYFLGYALGWMYYNRNEALADQLLTDVHSPAKYRVNGPFVNVNDFYSAFNIRPGAKMYRPDSLRVRIW
jgi:putative endopeptidase